MTPMNEVNRDKAKVPDYFFLIMFHLSVLLLNSMSKLIHNCCTCELIIKTLQLHTCMQTNNCVFDLCFNRYSLLFSSEIILKLHLGDYSTIFTEPEANNVNYYTLNEKN